MKIGVSGLAGALLLAGLSAGVQADRGMRYLLDDTHYAIDETGRVTMRWVERIRVTDKNGLEDAGQQSLPYNADRQQVDVESAFTIKQDGRRIPVDRATAVFDKPQGIAANLPAFSRIYLKFVNFPQLEVGDTTEVTFVRKDRSTLFPGVVSLHPDYPLDYPTDEIRLRVTLPAGMPLGMEVRDLKVRQDRVLPDGTRELLFAGSQAGMPAMPSERAQVAWSDFSAGVLLSTARDWAELGHLYQAAAASAMRVTPLVREQAAGIAGTASDPHEVARLLKDWVASSIRHVGARLGDGPLAPHPADVVLKNRFGDRKDMAALYIALLAARGIRAETALLDGRGRYRWSAVPDTRLLDTVLVWLPALGLFVDPADRYGTFGTLSEDFSGKTALIAETGETRQTPVMAGEPEHAVFESEIGLDEQGDATMVVQARLKGRDARNARHYAASRSDAEAEQEILSDFGTTGNLRFDWGDRTSSDPVYRMTVRGHLDELAMLPGPGGMPIPGLPGFRNEQAFVREVLDARDNKLDAVCHGGVLEQHFRIRFPATVRIVAVPRDVALEAGGVRYAASYRQDGQVVTASRVLERRQQGNVCTPAMYAGWQVLAGGIDRDGKGMILFDQVQP